MKTYTKTGDKGETSLFTGQRVKKDNGCLWFVGEIDELSSALGVTASFVESKKTKEFLETIQKDLFLIGVSLGGREEKDFGKYLLQRITLFEKKIDQMDNQLSPLHNFIIPGGTKSASLFHLSRSICRRAERRVLEFAEKEPLNNQIIAYLNRLSDLLFVFARTENKEQNIADKILGLDINKTKS